jgi:hypothetical protein
MFNSLRRGLLVSAVTALGVGGLALSASAATPGCTAVPGVACASWNAEVPNLPDLDVQGGAAVSGNVLIVFTRTNHDKAEDFRVENVDTTQHSTFDVSGSFNGGVVWHTASANVAVPGAVRIQYSPNGVASGLCVSSVNPNGFASAQLRHCADAGLFNPYQTFQRTDTGNPGDGQFVTFREVINGHLLTDPKNDGSIGVKGARIQVKFSGGTGTVHTGQLWGRNGA